MTAFNKSVNAIVATIPAGRVLTYGQLAMLIGEPRQARQVGRAMASVPAELKLPCHRVVAASGELAPPEVFGVGVQRTLLESEGIPFREDGRIHWKRYHACHKNG